MWTNICSSALGPIIIKGSPIYRCVYVYTRTYMYKHVPVCHSFINIGIILCTLFVSHGNPSWSSAEGQIHPFDSLDNVLSAGVLIYSAIPLLIVIHFIFLLL